MQFLLQLEDVNDNRAASRQPPRLWIYILTIKRRHICIGTLSLYDDEPLVVLAAGKKLEFQISWVADQASGKIVRIRNKGFAIDYNWEYIKGPEHAELANQCRVSKGEPREMRGIFTYRAITM